MAPLLPAEILRLIAESLFFFDSDPKVLYLDHWDAQGRRPPYTHGTMANMCLASKMMYDFTIPVLYRLPMTIKTAHLVRTLTERPDLAQHVRYLHHDCWNHWYEIDRDVLGPKFAELQAEGVAFIEKRVTEGEGGPLDEDAHGMLDELRSNTPNFQFQDSVVISLCPNLEKLHVSSYYHPVLPTMTADSLKKLTTATVSHGDTELAMHFHILFYLAKAAPNISTLDLHALSDGAGVFGGGPEYPGFPNVTTLRFERSLLDLECMPTVARAFPRLEHLAFHGGDASIGDGGMNARQMVAAFADHVPRLKSLELDMREFDDDDMSFPNDDDTESDARRGFTGLEHLESLTVDAHTLRVGLEGDDGHADGFPGEILVDTLPTSLKRLRIRWHDWNFANSNYIRVGLLRFAGEVSSRFTNLEEVGFLEVNEHDDVSGVRIAFEEAGVKVSVVHSPYMG